MPNKKPSASKPVAPASARAALAAFAATHRLKKRTKTDRAHDVLRTFVSESCAPDVVALVDFLASYTTRAIGLWRVAATKEMLPQRLAKEVLPSPGEVAKATGTLFLGKDGSGYRFYVLRSKTSSEVFIEDPGARQLAVLATSLAAFVELNDLVLRWDELCEAEEIDPDPEEMEDVDFEQPAFAALRARAKALKGRVNMVSRSDYDETVCGLAQATFKAKSGADVIARYAQMMNC